MSFLSVAFALLAITSVCMTSPSETTFSGPRLTQLLQPKPYQFGFQFEDGLGMNQHRREEADGTGAVKGSYGYVDALGVSRTVEYTADKNGYRAVIKINEPGTADQNAANTEYIVKPPPAVAVVEGLRAEAF